MPKRWKPPGLVASQVTRDEAPHLTMADIDAAGSYERAAERFAPAWTYRVFVLRETGVEMVVEVVPAALRAAHPGPDRPGWLPCPCDQLGGGHRRIELDCCGTWISLGCTITPAPPTCGRADPPTL